MRTNAALKIPSDADPAKLLHQRGELASAGLARAGGEHGKSLESFSLLLRFGTGAVLLRESLLHGVGQRGDKVIKAPARALWARILRPNSLRSRVGAPRNGSDDWNADLVFLELTTSDSLNNGGLFGRLGPHTENRQGWRFGDGGQSLREHRSKDPNRFVGKPVSWIELHEKLGTAPNHS